ncbi:regulatory protein [Betaproteobacteria bacterium]|nr:regulatory protein [Betaproteobacteria bacterium]GHU02080.1 regulatory protein [Betaproteobacteria bacterium]
MSRAPVPDLEKLLAGQPLFSGLLPGEVARIMRGMKKIDLHRGDILFNKGDECNGFHLLISGQIKLALTSPHGHEKVVEIIRPNQTFGEALMFMEKPYIVSAQALVDSFLLHFSKSVVFDELAHEPMLARKMIAGLSVRLHQLIVDVEDYSIHSGKQRIIGYLLREAADSESGNEAVVSLPISKGTIASRLNMTQEHFSRILHELVGLGLVTVKGRSVCIPDLNRLRQYED